MSEPADPSDRAIPERKLAPRPLLLIRLAAAVLFLAVAGIAQAQTAAPSSPTGAVKTAQVIVKFKQNSAIVRMHALSMAASAREASDQATARAKTLEQRHGVHLQAGRLLDRHTQVLSTSEVDNAELIRRLSADPDVEYAVVDQRRHHQRVPNDPLYTQGPAIIGSSGGPAVGQWYLRAPAGDVTASINAPAAWDQTTGSAAVVVAVLDTGVRPDHPELAGRLLGGYNMITDVATSNDGGGRDADASDPGDWVTQTEANNPSSLFFGCTAEDSSWHGTMTSTLIGAATNNGAGMAGVAWGIQLLPVRVLGKCGGVDSDIIAGMQWAAGMTVPGVPANPNPARVINMSLGSSDGSACPQSYIDALNAIGGLKNAPVIVVSAGNSNGHVVGTPANCPGVIAVTGLRHAGTKVGFADLGPEVAISAPAGNCVNTGPTDPCLYPILAATNTGTTTPLASSYTDSFNFGTGTSFSAPLVAGTAALMLSVQPSWTASQVKAALQASARAFPQSGVPADPQTGPITACHAPNSADQLQCYCTTTTCGAGMLDAAAAVAAAQASISTTSTSATTTTTTVTTTTTTTVPVALAINLSQGWNLLGNSVATSLDVATTFGNAANVVSVWKWAAATGRWAFYSPALADGGTAYAAARGFDMLSTINGGDGFWVNAKQPFTVTLHAGTAISASYFQDQLISANKLPAGWSLITIGDNITPSDFNKALGINPPTPGTIPLNLATLWAWDNATAKWYFYAPSLDAAGGTALTDYIAGKSYLDFTQAHKKLGPGVGFWVNRP